MFRPVRPADAPTGDWYEWTILTQGLGIKKYPTCHCTHRAIDCMLDLVNETPINPTEVEKITVSIGDYFATVLRNHTPDTGLAAKFSMEFAMASGIIARRVGLRALTDEFVQRPDIRAPSMRRARWPIDNGMTNSPIVWMSAGRKSSPRRCSSACRPSSRWPAREVTAHL